MRIVMVSQGKHPIPPPAFGPKESVIWHLSENLQRLGHSVLIINTPSKLSLVRRLLALRAKAPIDFVHCHHLNFCWLLLLLRPLLGYKLAVTDHSPRTDFSQLSARSRRKYFFAARADLALVLNSAQAALLRHFCSSLSIKPIRNGAQVTSISWQAVADAECVVLGKISERKGQVTVAKAIQGTGISCHFIGPGSARWDQNEGLPHLGEWTREELAAKLTRYSVLILFSRAEGQPLVVVEALAAGLSVVVSPAAAVNLDLDQPFVYVAQNESELLPLIRRALQNNPAQRSAIRAYAAEHFDYRNIAVEYAAILEDHLPQRKAKVAIAKAP